MELQLRLLLGGAARVCCAQRSVQWQSGGKQRELSVAIACMLTAAAGAEGRWKEQRASGLGFVTVGQTGNVLKYQSANASAPGGRCHHRMLMCFCSSAGGAHSPHEVSGIPLLPGWFLCAAGSPTAEKDLLDDGRPLATQQRWERSEVLLPSAGFSYKCSSLTGLHFWPVPRGLRLPAVAVMLSGSPAAAPLCCSAVMDSGLGLCSAEPLCCWHCEEELHELRAALAKTGVVPACLQTCPDLALSAAARFCPACRCHPRGIPAAPF